MATKPWNVALTNVKPDEQLYVDYEQSKITQTSVKFKTTEDRLKLWIAAHENVYKGEELGF